MCKLHVVHRCAAKRHTTGLPSDEVYFLAGEGVEGHHINTTPTTTSIELHFPGHEIQLVFHKNDVKVVC
jgi:hypothetical protein